MSLTAFTLVLFSALIHALWNFAAKKVSGNLSVIWIGMVLACLSLFPFIFFLDSAFATFSAAYPYIIASGIIHAIYFFSLSKAYEHGEISVVYPIARGSGIAGAAAAAVLFLEENVSLVGASGIAAVVAGIFLIGLKNGHQKRGVLFALLVGLMIMGFLVVDKLAVAVSHPLVYLLGFTSLGALILTPYMCFARRRELREAWDTKKKYALIIGWGSFITYSIVLFVMKTAPMSYVGPVREFAVAIGAVLGFVYLKERISFRKIMGLIGIVAGMVLIKLA